MTAEKSFSRLSPAQKEVLSFISQGKKAPQAAVEIGITSHTVKKHLQHIRNKFPAKNSFQSLTQAISYGIRNGDIEPSPLIPNPKFPLSPRERIILFFLGVGYSPAEISEALDRSDKTTKVHLKHLREKLGATSLYQLVATGITQRLEEKPLK